MDLDAEGRFFEYIRIHIHNVFNKQKETALYYKYWNYLDEKNNGKYGVMNYEYFNFINKLVEDMFPEHKSLPCYIPNATTLFIIDMTINITKFINPQNPVLTAWLKISNTA